MKEDIHTEQPTFNGMNRRAMVAGIPLPALAACGLAAVILTMATLPFLEGRALYSAATFAGFGFLVHH